MGYSNRCCDIIVYMFRIFFPKNKKRKARSRQKTLQEKQEDLLYKRCRAQAESLLKQRTEELAEQYGFQYNRVTIKNTKTRWGSCSTKCNINLHYKLMFVDDFYRDYVIIHELCHLRQMNHSALFWNEVADIMPEYKKAAVYMRKKHPHSLNLENLLRSERE